jgi:hypothetical protein
MLRTIDEPRRVLRVGANIFAELVDVLERMGRCGSARKYTSNLMALI